MADVFTLLWREFCRAETCMDKMRIALEIMELVARG